jgi:short-subunit dehydrogenase
MVTGASAGIGREIARLFARDGHDLVIVARRRERLQELADELESAYDVTVHVEPADLSEPDSPPELFGRLDEKRIQIDFLVNNAGFGSNGAFWELDPSREVDQIQVNVTSLAHLTRLALPGMVEREFGRILNIASTAGFQPGPYMSTYYATKAFVISFTEGIAHELKGTGVTATVHCPGATESEFAERAGNDESALFQKGAVASSEEVARHAYRSMQRGKVVAVHGAMNSFGAFMTRLSPRSMLRSVAASLNKTD